MKEMNSWLKKVLKILAVLAVLAGIGAGIGTWALQRYLTPEKVRGLVMAQAPKYLHREVRLGKISVGLVQGLVVEQLAISERPDFKAGIFAQARSLSVRLSLLPLLRRQYEFSRISADGLRLAVSRAADGTFNFSDLAGSTAPVKASAAPAAAAIALTVGKAVISDAGIEYHDALARQDWKLAVASAKLANFRPDGPFNADVDLRLEGRLSGKPLKAALQFSGKVNLGGGKPERMSADIKQLRLEESGRELRLKGKIVSLAAPKLDLRAEISLSGSQVLSAEAKGVVTSTGPRPAGDLALKLRTPGFDPAAAQIAQLVSLPLPKGQSVPEVSLEGRFKLSGDTLDLEGVKAQTKLGSLEAAGRLAKIYSGRPEPDIKALLHLEVPETKAAAVPWAKLPAGLVIPKATLDAKLSFKPWEAAFDSLRLKTALAQVEASGALRDLLSARPQPKDFKVKAHLDVPQTEAASAPWLKLPKGLTIPAATVDADIRLDSWDAAIQILRVKSGASTVEASGSIRDLLGRPLPQAFKAKVHLDLPRTKAASLPWLKLPEGLVVPAATADADFSLQGWDATISSLHVKTQGAEVTASGAVRDLMGKPRAQDLQAKLHLDLPQTKGSDIPLAKLPASLVIPALVLDSALRSDGTDVTLDSMNLKTKAGEISLKGVVKGALSGKPEPDLDIQAKFDLPAFKSEELPLPQVPPGLAVPASRIEADVSGGLDAVDLRRVRIVVGKNDLEFSGPVKGLRGGAPLLNLMLKCRSFVLEELTAISPETRELKLAGSGFFALGVSGPLAKPVAVGKMKFQGLGATVAGLPLSDFTGTAVFDEKRIDIPKLTGKVADGALAMDLTVKNYRAEPFIDLEASLDRFDLGRYLTAKAALAARQKEKAAQKAQSGKPSEKPKAPAPIATRGRFTVGELRHPNVTAKDLRLNWELDGITPDLKTLGGSAKVLVDGGKFNDIGKLATQSAVVKVLILPLMVIQKIGGIGGYRIFPDFNNIVFTEIAGDYAFADGLMTLKDTHLYSEAAQVDSKGTIDLPSEKLDLTVTAQVANVRPLDIKVTGTFAKPVTKTLIGKFIKDLFPTKREDPAPQGQ